MKVGATGSFAAHLRQLRHAAGFTQEELATIAGLSVAAVSALERGRRKRPHVETVRALSAALDLAGATRDALLGSARPAHDAAVDELSQSPLPLALTRLLGRDAEIQALREWFADSSARLITFTGPGGSGKTRLALELAKAIAGSGAARVVFVPLAAVKHPALVASEVASALGLSDASALDLPRRARIGCGSRPTLLVLDNFEQVLDAAPLIAELLTSVAALRVLVTSRSPLRLRGEREFTVGPLSLEPQLDAVAPGDPLRAPAALLFLERVRDVKPDFGVTTANSAIVTAICRRLDALPLALELAAPWMKVLTPEDLLERIEQNVLLPGAGSRDLPERQQTINATVGWSYQLLHPDEQRLFRRLGALPARFSLEAAEAVIADREDTSPATGEVLVVIAGLIDKSLLHRAETSVANRPMYRMLETVRAFANLELAAAGGRDDALEATARYCAREASRAADGLVGPAQVEWLNRVRDELEIYRGALAWLIEHRRSAEASEIAWKLKYFWMIRGHAAEGIRWYEHILGLPSLPPAAESRAIVGTAVMWFTQGDLVRARTGLDRAMALAQATADREMIAQVDNLVGHIERADGHVDLARSRFERSLAAFQALAYPSGIGNALTGMAVIALASNDPGRAERLLDEATSILRQAGPWFLAWTLYVRAVLAVQREDADRAMRWVRESLTHVRELHDRFVFVYSLVPLAAAAVLKGDDEWAARILGARDAVTERTGVIAVDRSVHELRGRAEREVRARLGAERWTRAYAAGRSTSVDSLVKDIDLALEQGQRSTT
jgi:predicted ATPase/DNA-binding XRE family transcriptional regulator